MVRNVWFLTVELRDVNQELAYVFLHFLHSTFRQLPYLRWVLLYCHFACSLGHMVCQTYHSTIIQSFKFQHHVFQWLFWKCRSLSLIESLILLVSELLLGSWFQLPAKVIQQSLEIFSFFLTLCDVCTCPQWKLYGDILLSICIIDSLRPQEFNSDYPVIHLVGTGTRKVKVTHTLLLPCFVVPLRGWDRKGSLISWFKLWCHCLINELDWDWA